jgi:hypothetical protein
MVTRNMLFLDKRNMGNDVLALLDKKYGRV